MKRIQFIYVLCLGVVMSFTACDDFEFIQPEPEDRITREIALGDLGGIDALVASGYNHMINFNYYGRNS